MKTLKQIISTILLLAILVGIVPTNVLATDATTSVQAGQTTIEGTNSFGALLSEDIQEQQNEDAESSSGGYNVTGLTIENGIATIEYSTLEKAVLVVALYSEDGIQLLLSGKTIVEPEDAEASIELEGEVPEYFMASAYLLDTYDYSPLCESYDTPMYTKEMQELLASTTDDYDADKVLNLDDDKTTNFAVYADTTIVLEYIEGVNTVVSADDETAIYVIENADDNTTKLKTGDILAYAYGENQILIVKISSIDVAGTTVTISGADVEMEEVFSHVKLETTGDASDVTVDESTAEEGVIYDGLSSEGPQTYSLRAVEGESGWKHYLNFKLVDKKLKDETENLDVSVSISGSLGISIDVKFSYFVSTDRQFIEFKADAGVKAAISISGKIKSKLPLPEFKLSAYGVSIGFEPKLQLEFSGKVEYSFFAGFTIGISYENGKGIHDLSTAPKVESEFKLEGSVFFGIDLTPTIEVLKGAIVEAKLEAPIGFELKASLKGTMIEGSDSDADSVHTCEKCVEMELNFKAEFSAKLKFLKCKWLSLETKAKAVEVKIRDMYWSIDRDQFAWGKCPYISYRVTVYVQNSENQAVANTDVVAGWAEKLAEIPLGKTNSNGVVVYYLQEGTYTFMATFDGENLGKTVTVEESCKVVLGKNATGNNPEFIFSTVNPKDITDYGAVVASGECGVEGDNVIWTQYENGILVIDGAGEMEDFLYSWTGNNIPWGGSIQYVIINDGVTSIGKNAFRDMDYIESIAIPPSIRSIREDAFYVCSGIQAVYISDLKAWCEIEFQSVPFSSSCGNLFVDGLLAENLDIPAGITGIKPNTFRGCTNLKSVKLPDGITYIGNQAFYGCENLTKIHIPNGVTSIGIEAFYKCSSLSTISIPNTVTIIGGGTFRETGLTQITLSDNLISIEPFTFVDCKNLTSVVIPEGVINIGGSAFGGCTNLTVISLPSHLSAVNGGTFHDCCNLTEIKIPDGATYIGDDAFRNCGRLTEIAIPDSVTNIGEDAFRGCSALTAVYINDIGNWCNITFGNIYSNPLYLAQNLFVDGVCICEIVIPDGVTHITAYAFASIYNRLHPNRIVIPNSVTDIGNFAFYYLSPEAIIFKGDAPNFGNKTFLYSYATIYYPSNNETWTTDVLQSYGGSITWIPYTLDAIGETIVDTAGAMVTVALDEVQDNSETEAEDADYGISTLSIWGGEYETEVTDTYTLKRAFFTGLVPGEEYVLLALVNIEVEEILAPDNLLYIDQEVATEDGTLVFTYVQREATNLSYVMACGASHNDINNATVTFPELTAGAETQTVDPTVVYDGNTLVEGVDYVIVGTVDYTVAGEYTCYIRGIYNYSGVVECTYTVTTGEPEVIFGEKVYHNLRLQDLTKIGYAFTITTDETVDEYGVLIWTGNADDVVTVDTEGIQNKMLAYDSGFYTTESDGVYAQRLDILHYAKPYVKIGDQYIYGSVDTYSPLSYAQTILNGSDEKLKQLMIDLLNYGTYAQLYFAESNKEAAPEVLINDILTEEQKVMNWSDDLKVATPTVTKDTAKTLETKWYGTNLNLLEAIQMNMAATGNITGMYYWTEEAYNNAEILNSASASGEAKIRVDGNYTIGGLTGIVAQSVSDVYYVCGYDESGNLGAIRADSVAAYATRLMESTASTEATRNLAKALLIYGDSAEVYFAQND